MDMTFGDLSLQVLRDDPDAKSHFAAPIVKAYRKTLNIIERAKDERDIYAMNSLRFKRLQGDRQHQHSLRLNDQWRLIVEIQEAKPRNIIRVVAIEDYH